MSKRAQWLAVVALGVGTVALFRPAGGTAQQPVGVGTGLTGLTGGPKYTIVQTEGTNLLVVDNSSNTLYYYTVDPGKEVGDDLKLRGSVDLNEVGRPVVKPRHAR